MPNNRPHNHSRKYSKNPQAGFTLVELLVVCAVTGFIVLAATGIMVSFTRIKYSADVQVQLKTEATFAANQIDLLIRNSSGLPDLCISQYRDSSGNPQFCNGSYQQDFRASGNTSCDVNALTPAELEACWGYSESHCIYEPVAPYPANTPRDIFTTFDDGNGIKYTSSFDKKNGIAPTLLHEKSYRYQMFGGAGAFANNKNYLITQAAKQEPSKNPPGSEPESTFFRYDVARSNNNICSYNGVDNICQNLQTVYYNQIISIKRASAGASSPQLAVNEFVVGAQLDPGSSGTITSQPANLFPLARELAQNDFTSYPKTVTTKYLTSQSVSVESLSFECTMRNYGLPTQAAAIRYTLTVAIPKESYNSQYEDLRDTESPSLTLAQRASYESFSITRLVTVRNGSQPFRFNQHN